ncbi:hypothetical protein GCM10017562_01360 [Streptomyces roseofulvus]|uniref:hypothetical protein n=1 Tax=Streptomyces roseofulvus TaxID=33902 RepID=UPI0031F7EC4B
MERTTFPLDLLTAQTRATAAYQALAVSRPVHPAALRRALIHWETAVFYHPYWTGRGRSAGGRADLRRAARTALTHRDREEATA